MLTIKDCLGMCQLCEEAILAIAEHEHLPEIIALEMAEDLIQTPSGVPTISRMIQEDIESARANNDASQVACLQSVLNDLQARYAVYS